MQDLASPLSTHSIKEDSKSVADLLLRFVVRPPMTTKKRGQQNGSRYPARYSVKVTLGAPAVVGPATVGQIAVISRAPSSARDRRQQRMGKEIAFRADAAFAKPEIYEALEERGVKYAIRIPANDSPGRDIAELLTQPLGRPSRESINQ